jgi:glutamate racemase
VIEPGAKAAVIAAGARQFPTIGVIATEATVKSKAYEKAIHRRRHLARILLRPTPLLVPIIEEGRDANDPIVRLAIQQYLEPLLQRGIDVLVLGCTHYPVFRALISEMAGPSVAVIDSAQQCADDVARRLGEIGLLRSSQAIVAAQRADEHRGTLRCFVTDDPQRFQRLAPRFLGVEIDPPVWIAPDELYGPSLGGLPVSVPA